MERVAGVAFETLERERNPLPSNLFERQLLCWLMRSSGLKPSHIAHFQRCR